jgi:large subunit ribosomal protein LP0
MVNVSARKAAYRVKLEKYLEEFKTVMLVNIDNVGSNQLQKTRANLRGRAEILCGKNTMIRMILRELVEAGNADLEKLLEKIVGNIAFVFTNEDVQEIRSVVAEIVVPAGARPGILAPIDVFIPAGPTGQDPGQTGFFQALNIGTKIVRGQIEITADVHICKKGEKIGNSEVTLLNKLNIKPFTYGIECVGVYDEGSFWAPEILDMTDDILLGKFFNGVAKVASIGLALGLPNAASVPHSLGNGLKTLIAVAVETDYTFSFAEKIKAYLADPSAFASAAPAGGDNKAEAAAAAVEESEEESSEEGFDLFD